LVVFSISCSSDTHYFAMRHVRLRWSLNWVDIFMGRIACLLWMIGMPALCQCMFWIYKPHMLNCVCICILWSLRKYLSEKSKSPILCHFKLINTNIVWSSSCSLYGSTIYSTYSGSCYGPWAANALNNRFTSKLKDMFCTVVANIAVKHAYNILWYDIHLISSDCLASLCWHIIDSPTSNTFELFYLVSASACLIFWKPCLTNGLEGIKSLTS
jgi:hypothetical protein